MAVRINEAGQHDPITEINDACVGFMSSTQLGIADGNDAFTIDEHRLGHGQGGIHGDDPPHKKRGRRERCVQCAGDDQQRSD